MPPLVPSPAVRQSNLTANQIGSQAMPLQQPVFHPVTDQTTRAPSFVRANQQFATSSAPGRPYSDVGKMTVNLVNPSTVGDDVQHTQGMIQGLGAGLGGILGGIFGQQTAGANIGGFVGGIGQIPMDALANVMGAIPAVPGLPGSGGVTGRSLIDMTPAQRDAAMKGWDGNPMTFFHALGQIDQADWDRRIKNGEINPLLESLGRPAGSFGDQFTNLLGIFGIPSKLLERTYAGGGPFGQGELQRILDARPEELDPAVVTARDAYKQKLISKDRLLDVAVANNAGYSNNPFLNMLGEAVFDPSNLLFGAGAAIGFGQKVAQGARAFRFGEIIGTDGVNALRVSRAADVLAKSGEVIPDITKIAPRDLVAEAQRTGQYGAELQQATSELTPAQRAFLHPVMPRLEKIADATQKILNPFDMIGRRGTKPIENAWASRETTKGVAQAYGLGTFSKLGDRMDLAKPGVFDRGLSWASGYEAMLQVGDTVASDVMATRKIVDARPTAVTLARAGVGSQSHAAKIAQWMRKRMQDTAILTGGTKAEAEARAMAHSTELLSRQGYTDTEIARTLKGASPDYHSLIDLQYFGNRIGDFSETMRSVREGLSNTVAAAGGVPTKAQETLQATLDRLTLIGPREITQKRAQGLLDAIKIGDKASVQVVRDAVHQYDLLAYEFPVDEMSDADVLTKVKKWLDDFDRTLTKEIDDSSVPSEFKTPTNAGDGYIYGLRPEDGAAEWRIVQDEEGKWISSRPWIDIPGSAAQPWNLKFRGQTGNPVHDFMNAIERSMRAMGAQITSDKIEREVRRGFVERAMTHSTSTTARERGVTGLSYNEARGLYRAVRERALDASTGPRGMTLHEFQQVIDENPAAQRIGMSSRDLATVTIGAFEGNLGTVGLTQKLSGAIKTSAIRTTGGNTIGLVAERLYPFIRFTANPLFQAQEWLEPWVFAAARGKMARLSGGFVYDTAEGRVVRVTNENVDAIQQHMMDRYTSRSGEANWDQMERGMTYVFGAAAAKNVIAHSDRNILRRGLAKISPGSVHGRKAAAQSEMFRYFLGPMLKDQFDKINPGYWAELEQWAGTKDMGTIAVRWMVEKDKWASADPKIAYHLMDAVKEPAMGARSAVNLEENARVIFNTTREGLATRVRRGFENPALPEALTKDGFADLMRDVGAHDDYIDRTWKVMQLEAHAGGMDGWWADAVPLAKGGKKEVAANRALIRSFAETMGISESELIARAMQHSPVSLLHDDLIAATEADLAAWGVHLQRSGYDTANYFAVDPVTGATRVNTMWKPMADMEFLKAAQSPPQDLPFDHVGDINNFKKVTFGKGGRDVFIPGGVAALKNTEKPWTTWEAHVIRAQMIDPQELLDPVLKHALYEKMWRAHQFDMTDPENVYRLFNNNVMAMTSAGLNLTRNELVSTRFRVGSMDDLRSLAADAAQIRKTVGDEPGDIGLAYSTQQDVAHYIPLDNRRVYMKDGMLPERQVFDPEKGKTVTLPATAAVVEERAGVASAYLNGSTVESRAHWDAIDTAQDAHRATLKGDAKKAYKPPQRLQHWAIDEFLKAFNSGGVLGLDSLPKMFGVKRSRLFKPDEIDKIAKASETLATDPLNLEARGVIAPFVSKMKKADDAIIFKDWNVNRAGLPHARMPGADPFAHGDKPLYAYLKNDDVAWRGFSTNGNMGRALQMAQDMVANSSHYVKRPGETLDEFAERISHRTDGLSLKTSYFGVDLGDPINFERGVMDTHMVGDLTEFMYYGAGKEGKSPEWKAFFDSLSPDKQKEVAKWVGEGAKRGAGVYDWSEASGIPIAFKAAGAKGSELASHMAAGDYSTVAAWMRTKVDALVANPNSKITAVERDRLLKMYPTDQSLAELYGREVSVLGGDYQIYDRIMADRKAVEAVADPTLLRHGNGGYQWKLWDDRRHVWDPEATAFATAHNLPRRSVRYMAASDDAHFAAGFMDKGGLKPVTEAGYSYLDPVNTIMAQKNGKVIRGATITMDDGEKILGITKYRNRSTLQHELLHVVAPTILDPSGRNVIIEDFNRVVREGNADILPGGAGYDTAKAAVDVAQTEVDAATTAVAAVRPAFDAAQSEAIKAVDLAESHERTVADLNLQVAERKGAVDQLVADAPSRRRVIETQKLSPSIKTRRLATIDNEIARATTRMEAVIAKRELARDAIEPAWDAANVSRATAAEAKGHLDAATAVLRDKTKVHKQAVDTFDGIATRPVRAEKTGWDTDVEHHFVDEFAKWTATGKAANPKLRDAFAYFRKVLIKIYQWAKGQPGHKVSPEMEQLFNDLTTPRMRTTDVMANAMPFDATEEALHAAAIQSVVDAEDAAFTNVQFRRGRSWLERSINHPYMGIYPSSYMWGKVVPEMVRALAVNPFGFPIPILTKPVKINGVEFGLHGSPFAGFVNAQRFQNSIEQQKDSDPEFAKQVDDPTNNKIWRNILMFMPGTPWDSPANWPLWTRRIAEYGLTAQDRAATPGAKPAAPLDLLGLASDITGYANGPQSTFDWLDTVAKTAEAPFVKGLPSRGGSTVVGPRTAAQRAADAQAKLQQKQGAVQP